MDRKHFVIIVPGLGDEIRATKFLTWHFRRNGLEPVVHRVGWQNEEQEFKPKLDRFVRYIDELSKKGTVSLIGCSAGGSAVLNAFLVRPKAIEKVVTVCARLRTGPTTGWRSFAAKTKSSNAFAQSVKLFESRERELTRSYRKRILTVHAMFGDELVPPETATVEGAYTIKVPTMEHVASIAAALSVFSGEIIRFILK